MNLKTTTACRKPKQTNPFIEPRDYYADVIVYCGYIICFTVSAVKLWLAVSSGLLDGI